MIYLVIFISLNTLSQVILKKESNSLESLKNHHFIINMFKNYKVILAYIISFIGIFIWILALSEITLIEAIILSSISYVIMFIVDYIIFKVKVSKNKIIGASLILFGILLSSI